MTSWLESMPGVAVRTALEKAVAKVIELDVVTARRLGELDGQVLQVCCTLPELTFYIRFRESVLDLLAVCEESVTASLKGSALELLGLTLADDPMAQLQKGDIELSGSSDLLLMLAGILRESDFDWEALIARHTGGVIAHAIGSVARAGAETTRHLTDAILANLPEYLQEELRLLPATGEVEAFQEDLDDMRLAVDRVEARIQRLTNKTVVKTGGQ
ncbi:SCP2 sterol-binding domain-containing protein [Sansalvadorimonas sp. 2012CJ34-2]|uniref:Ubiquinone biosynthesis accessory factor UbiJ n=1 Tax=Parendozoicomonas callyspongiae TaxID=2942213 RepID=A0ABT0PIM8_9GAMM|nr:SCP2 sterol-binding domain-containing protein [Sansalvadorimonas sp. 2012CJ34-2]MCL6270607.1 SCP2 sterol-binding domain-containing protein [Sansalvadorimonas sp. 2012CJ34-2]